MTIILIVLAVAIVGVIVYVSNKDEKATDANPPAAGGGGKPSSPNFPTEEK
jgi:flagellar basal body-associated protein FliL